MCYDQDERGRYGSLTSIESTKGHHGNWINFVTGKLQIIKLCSREEDKFWEFNFILERILITSRYSNKPMISHIFWWRQRTWEFERFTVMPPLLMGLDGQYESRGMRESKRRKLRRDKERQRQEDEEDAKRPKAEGESVRQKREQSPFKSERLFIFRKCLVVNNSSFLSKFYTV